MNKIYDQIDYIRRDFPILANNTKSGNQLIYMDSAATSQKPKIVIDAITTYYSKYNCNIHRGKYDLSQKTSKLFDGARKTVADFIGADPENIIFTKGTTESLNFVADIFERVLISGNVVLTSELEHHSNIVPFQKACKRKGARLIPIPITDAGDIDIKAYEALISRYGNRIKLVTVCHISNAIGTVNPIKNIIELAHKHNIPVCVDAAQSIAHEKIDVKLLDCDFLAFSGHKCYASTGIGVLYMKMKYELNVQPFQYGGGAIKKVSFEDTILADIPERFEAGTPHISGVFALDTAIKYINNWNIINIYNYEKHLKDYCLFGLKKIQKINIIGDPENRAGIISFNVGDIHPDDVCKILSENNICVRSGYMCAIPLMARFKQINGVVRVSFGIFNTFAEIDKLCESLAKL